MLPAAPRNCKCNFFKKTPNQVEVEVEVEVEDIPIIFEEKIDPFFLATDYN